jgi:hypothetical protein
MPRPRDLIEGVLEGTTLTVADFETGNPFFGHQIWLLRQDSGKDDAFASAKALFKQRITALHHQGLIRYGSW